jgi:methyl-accepting chemotaxis protein
MADQFMARPQDNTAAGAEEGLRLISGSLSSLSAGNAPIGPSIAGIEEQLDIYRKSFATIVANTISIDSLMTDMRELGNMIAGDASSMRAGAVADERRIQRETDILVASTRELVMLLSVGVVVLGTTLAWLLGIGISRPIIAMCGAMRELAGGNFEVVLPGLGRGDEIGQMASAVKNKAAAEAHRAELQRFADHFEGAVGSIVANVEALAGQLEGAAGTLTRTAEITENMSRVVRRSSEEASANLQSVASATEELSMSVSDITRQVQESTFIAQNAVTQARGTDARIGKLSEAAQQIGEVIKLVNVIADQTNLLALNATIESARAGDAGRGFAVVASEVKSLANQTAKATEGISTHISGMQQATQESVTAIKEIVATIDRVSEIAEQIEIAVGQQVTATQEIAQNAQRVAKSTQEVSGNVADVNRGASETGEASSAVLHSARTLSSESARLRRELDQFMATIRAA